MGGSGKSGLKSLIAFKNRLLHFGLNPVLISALAAIGVFTFFRLILIALYHEHVPDGDLSTVLLQGLRVDFASVCGLFAPSLLLLGFLNLLPVRKVPRAFFRIISLYTGLGFAFIIMNELATYGFIKEFGVRPNHIYVQYLIYPKEVFSTLWVGHKLETLICLVAVPLSAWIFYKMSMRLFRRYAKGSPMFALTALLLTVCVVPLGIRSSLGHRPLNPAMVSFTDDALANSLPVNSSYNVVYALLHLDDVKIGENEVYRLADTQDVLNEALRFSARVQPRDFDPKCPINQVLQPFTGYYTGKQADTFHMDSSKAVTYDTRRRLNVVIVLEESLGANFVASMGGFPVTPYLEKLKEYGWWFENMYAAGHRSVRGIEAVTAGMPPSALNSIVKLPKPSEQYATLANIFSLAGYRTGFIYGGESHFDNMRSYFLENGAETVVEQKDYDNPSFVASWGVSDEDLFKRADDEFMRLHEAGENFFYVVFSSSFHDPFEIPEGKVSLDGLETDEPERLLAAKYADFAMGNFMLKAMHRPYGKDTVFLIIADHESRVRGAGTFPLHDFTIPALIIAPNVKPHKDLRQVSQIDMPMTLMSLAGLEGEVPNVGQNLTRSDVRQRAIVQFNEVFGLLEDRRFLQIAPHGRPYMFAVGTDGETLTKMPHVGENMLERAVRLSNLGPVIYDNNYMSVRCVKLSDEITAGAMKNAKDDARAAK